MIMLKHDIYNISKAHIYVSFFKYVYVTYILKRKKIGTTYELQMRGI